jgi:carbon-monoxide dehydrogenase medium subunit
MDSRMRSAAEPSGRVIPAPMLLPRFDFEAPGSLAKACEMLAQAGREGRVMAGGTDLLVKMKRGAVAPRVVISLGRLDALASIEVRESGLRLGSCATMSRIASHPAVLASWQALAEGAGWVGGPIVRNRATVGGNVVNARPCADTLPPLIALHALLELTSGRGQRRVPVEGFVESAGQCAMGPDEILTAIDLPTPPPNAGSHYIKVTRRAAMDVTLVGCAASVVLDEARQRVLQARLVYTSVAPIPMRIPAAERLVEGEAPSVRVLEAAAHEAKRLAPVLGDHRAPQDYRAELVFVTTCRALKGAIERAGGAVR